MLHEGFATLPTKRKRDGASFVRRDHRDAAAKACDVLHEHFIAGLYARNSGPPSCARIPQMEVSDDRFKDVRHACCRSPDVWHRVRRPFRFGCCRRQGWREAASERSRGLRWSSNRDAAIHGLRQTAAAKGPAARIGELPNARAAAGRWLAAGVRASVQGLHSIHRPSHHCRRTVKSLSY